MKVVGVYQIKNLKNNKIYIGSSITVNSRMKCHLNNLIKNKHHSKYLQRSWNKYGQGNFEFKIIHECNKYILRDLEQWYMDILKPEYNMTIDAIAPMMGKRHSVDTRKKMSNSSPRFSGKDHHLHGKKQTFEHINKSIKSRTGLKRTELTKKKMSDTAKRIDSISRVDRDAIKRKIKDNLGNEFKSMTECANFHGISPSTICDILMGRHKMTKRNVIFKYSEDETPFKSIVELKNDSSLNRSKSCSKLNIEQVMFVKDNKDIYSKKQLAVLFNVKPKVIGDIIIGRTWRHI